MPRSLEQVDRASHLPQWLFGMYDDADRTKFGRWIVVLDPTKSFAPSTAMGLCSSDTGLQLIISVSAVCWSLAGQCRSPPPPTHIPAIHLVHDALQIIGKIFCPE
jgi:hypothetical protein